MGESSKQVFDPCTMSDHELLQIFKSAREKGAHFMINYADRNPDLSPSTDDTILIEEEIKCDQKSFDSNAKTDKLNGGLNGGTEKADSLVKKTAASEIVSSGDEDCSLSTISKKKKRGHICLVCQLSLPTRIAYGLHHHEMHSGSKQCGNAKKFNCLQCSKTFASPTTYLDHVLSHASTAEYSYICSQCSFKFASRKELYRHKLAHKGKRFLCPICGQAFNYKSDKDRHMKFHAGKIIFSFV